MSSTAHLRPSGFPHWGYVPGVTRHHEEGHINAFCRDHHSCITAYGKHDRVVAFQPNYRELYTRVDHKWNLGMPSHADILEVARKEHGIKGHWVFDREERSPDGRFTEVYFKRSDAT